ncbi:MAG: 30S ribosomal protein S6 [Myxococcota bacterium]
MSRAQLAPGHAREYETIYILRPNLDKEQANDVATRVADAIKGTEGVLTEAEFWGQRRLAYPIERHHRGTYVYLKYLGRGGTVDEIERQLRLVDTVIRYQTVQLQANVPMEGRASSEDDVSIDYELDFQPDEPEMSRERELGLDAPPPERRRRDDRDRSEARSEDKGGDGDAAKADEKNEGGGDDAKAEAPAAEADGDA